MAASTHKTSKATYWRARLISPQADVPNAYQNLLLQPSWHHGSGLVPTTIVY